MVNSLITALTDTFQAVLGGVGSSIVGLFNDLIYYNHDIGTDPDGTLTADIVTPFAEFMFILIGLGLAVGVVYALMRKASR